jgi:uncharacterized protein
MTDIDVDADIAAFLAGSPFAVAGASVSREKFGNKVLRRYWQAGRTAYPVNPSVTLVEGAQCYADLSSLPQPVHAVSIVTPPAMSAVVVDEALKLGIKYLWFQPGAEHAAAIAKARALGVRVIAHGPCVLVVLGQLIGRDSAEARQSLSCCVRSPSATTAAQLE